MVIDRVDRIVQNVKVYRWETGFNGNQSLLASLADHRGRLRRNRHRMSARIACADQDVLRQSRLVAERNVAPSKGRANHDRTVMAERLTLAAFLEDLHVVLTDAR